MQAAMSRTRPTRRPCSLNCHPQTLTRRSSGSRTTTRCEIADHDVVVARASAAASARLIWLSPLSARHSGVRAQRGSPESITPVGGYGYFHSNLSTFALPRASDGRASLPSRGGAASSCRRRSRSVCTGSRRGEWQGVGRIAGAESEPCFGFLYDRCVERRRISAPQHDKLLIARSGVFDLSQIERLLRRSAVEGMASPATRGAIDGHRSLGLAAAPAGRPDALPAPPPCARIMSPPSLT